MLILLALYLSIFLRPYKLIIIVLFSNIMKILIKIIINYSINSILE
jgi:hypothetical protein